MGAVESRAAPSCRQPSAAHLMCRGKHRRGGLRERPRPGWDAARTGEAQPRVPVYPLRGVSPRFALDLAARCRYSEYSVVRDLLVHGPGCGEAGVESPVHRPDLMDACSEAVTGDRLGGFAKSSIESSEEVCECLVWC